MIGSNHEAKRKHRLANTKVCKAMFYSESRVCACSNMTRFYQIFPTIQRHCVFHHLQFMPADAQ